jgi:hypothetical protein
MQWLLLMIIVSADGSITPHILSQHDTMAGCHVAGTRISWEERMPVNKEMVCLATDIAMRTE